MISFCLSNYKLFYFIRFDLFLNCLHFFLKGIPFWFSTTLISSYRREAFTKDISLWNFTQNKDVKHYTIDKRIFLNYESKETTTKFERFNGFHSNYNRAYIRLNSPIFFLVLTVNYLFNLRNEQLNNFFRTISLKWNNQREARISIFIYFILKLYTISVRHI